jgi:cysteine desulfurase
MVYLDHNATTPVRPEVLEAMLPYLRGEFGNPNSIHKLGQRARKALERAREQVAALLGAGDAQEILFTSCGSESDVTAVAGAAWQVFDETSGRKRRIVSSTVEHDAVRGILGLLSRRGFAVDLAPVDAQGLLDARATAGLITEAVAVVSVMHANNEVGTIQPVSELAAACRRRGVLFHTDAVQSAGKLPIDVRKMGADLLSVSGHKINAPKGVGALYVRKGVRLQPSITGHQEKNRRGGTENVASIVGLGAACELALTELSKTRHYAALARTIEAAVLDIPGSRLNGHPDRRLPNCSHFSFEGLDGHALVVALDLEGICVSSGPACSSGSSAPSHVLTAMGLPEKLAAGSIRVSTGWSTTEADVERFLEVLPGAVERLRKVPATL